MGIATAQVTSKRGPAAAPSHRDASASLVLRDLSFEILIFKSRMDHTIGT
jgi:hypothetical protein